MSGPIGMNYQQLIANQLQQQQETAGMFSPSACPPQITSQPPGILPIPSAKTPPNPNILPNSLTSPSILTGTTGNNGQLGPVGITKPQSPFHQSFMYHMGSNCELPHFFSNYILLIG